MPGPQSTTFFLLMMGTFGALMWWLIAARQTVFRVLAACLAFVPAMMFGVGAVNKYYDYYQTWHAAIADATGQSVGTKVPNGAVNISKIIGQTTDKSVAEQLGNMLQLTVSDPVIHITRTVLVYLPPQYFQPAYRHYRFPAIELIHGFPGLPQDWISVLTVNAVLRELMSAHKADPAVLVMPDANGGRAISLQCLNQVRGPQDATYLAGFLPGYIATKLRVLPQAAAWGIAGYSEGGFCAANLGLTYHRRFAYAGVLSGYFKPADNQLRHPSRLVSPFGGNRRLQRLNTPMDQVQSLPAGVPIPKFWLGAGSTDRSDIRDAQLFAQFVELRQPGAVLREVPGGGHTMFTWRALLPPMLGWMTQGLEANAIRLNQPGARAAHSPAAGRSPAAHPSKSAVTPRKPVKKGRSRP